MKRLQPKIRNAQLQDVTGKSVKKNGIVIVPAMVRLDGMSFGSSFALREISRERIPAVLRAPIENMYDVAWVWARFESTFGISPVQSENEKTLLEEGFVAVEEGADEGLAFICSDYYGKTSLTFSSAETDEAMKEKIAEAFWGILLDEPESLSDFEAPIMHSGTGMWMTFGCKMGEPFCHETEDGPTGEDF